MFRNRINHLPSHQHVHLVRSTGSQIVGQILPGEMGSRLRSQLVPIAHLVQQNVFANVLRELDPISGLANSGHHQVVGNLVDFTFICVRMSKYYKPFFFGSSPFKVRKRFRDFRSISSLPSFSTMIEWACVQSAANITKSGPRIPIKVSIFDDFYGKQSHSN